MKNLLVKLILGSKSTFKYMLLAGSTKVFFYDQLGFLIKIGFKNIFTSHFKNTSERAYIVSLIGNTILFFSYICSL